MTMENEHTLDGAVKCHHLFVERQVVDFSLHVDVQILGDVFLVLLQEDLPVVHVVYVL